MRIRVDFIPDPGCIRLITHPVSYSTIKEKVPVCKFLKLRSAPFLFVVNMKLFCKD
jgi:hypothetical protein